jgi:hypothetical protein
LRKLGVTHWLSFLVVAWGAVELAMGFVPTWQLLGLFRVLLGTFEVREFLLLGLAFISIILMSSNQKKKQAGFFPAMVYIITTWYVYPQI